MKSRNLATLTILSLATSFATAKTKNLTTYQVDRAWFDDKRIYIVYKEESSRVEYSITDIHGTVRNSNKNVQMLSYERSDLVDGKLVGLKDGQPASDVIYKDRDFEISGAGSQRKLLGAAIPTPITVCVNGEETGSPIRWRDGIFYCGSYYDRSGGMKWTVPRSVVDSIATEMESTNRSELFRRVAPVFCMDDDGTLIVTLAPKDFTQLRFGRWSVGSDSISWHSPPNAPRAAGSVVNGVSAYSPNRPVLRAENDRGDYWLQCNLSTCSRINALDANGSYLLLDQKSREAITLSISNLAKPELRVRLTKF